MLRIRLIHTLFDSVLYMTMVIEFSIAILINMKLYFFYFLSYVFADVSRSVSHGTRVSAVLSTDPEEIVRLGRSYYYRHYRKSASHQRRRSFSQISRKFFYHHLYTIYSHFQNYGIIGTKCQVFKNRHFTIRFLNMIKQSFY